MSQGGGDKKSEIYKSAMENLPHPIKKGTSRDIAASKLGMSGKTAEKASKVINYADSIKITEPEKAKEICVLPLVEGLDLDIEDDLLVYLKDTPEVKKLVLMELEEQNRNKGTINNKFNKIGKNQFAKVITVII